MSDTKLIVSINITDRHISEGIACSCTHCPIALAILPWLKPGVSIAVMGDVEFKVGPMLAHSELPPEAKKWQGRFDLGLEVRPFQFDLEINEAFLR